MGLANLSQCPVLAVNHLYGTFLQKNGSKRGDQRFISFFDSVLGVSKSVLSQTPKKEEHQMFERVLNTPLEVVTARGPIDDSTGSETVRDVLGSVTKKTKNGGGVEPDPLPR